MGIFLASAGLNGSSVVIRAALDFNSGVHASAAQAGFSSWLSAALSYWSHQPPFQPPCATDGNHKRPTFFIELWKATWGRNATTFASWPCKFSRSAVRWEWWKKLQLRSHSAPPPAHSLTLCVSPAGVQLLHCVGPLACRTPDSQRAPSLPPTLAPSLPLRLFCSVPVFLFPALTQCYLRFNAARRRSAPSAGICKPALQGKKQTHLGSVTVI